MIISTRLEKPSDIKAIHDVTFRAFEGTPFSDGSEADIVDQMRRDSDIAYSIVATERERLVGQVTVSKVSVGPVQSGWYGIGPIAVNPDFQGQGVGSQLMKAAIEHLQQAQAAGVVLVGDPAFYARFGFAADGSITYMAVPDEFVQYKILHGPKQNGEVVYPAALQGA